MSELTTKWPDIKQYGVPGGFVNGPKGHERGAALVTWGVSHLQEEVTYERARAEAALERLRLAVEALKDIAPDVASLRRPVEWWENRALSALSAIDLPPVQKES